MKRISRPSAHDVARIGIAGFDDVEAAAWPTFDLTTYSLPIETMIDKAVAILAGGARASAARAKDPVHVMVDGILKPRRSTLRHFLGS